MKVLVLLGELYPYWVILKRSKARRRGYQDVEFEEVPDDLVSEYVSTARHLSKLICKIGKFLKKKKNKVVLCDEKAVR